jgi:DNA-binding PadR family transcriptional regulator
MGRSPEELAAGEWAVLAALAEGPTHGFAVARLLAREGDAGQIWTVRRALVYHSIDKLVELGLAETTGDEASASGPRRTMLRATALGKRRVARWLQEPVDHLRDGRSLLMLKLLFLSRRGADPTRLLEAQRAEFERMARGFEARTTDGEGFTPTLALWRLESARAGIRFVDRLLAR